MNFALAFKSAMDSCGIRGVTLATELGMSTNSISQIRRGLQSPRVADFEAMLVACERIHPGFERLFLQHLLSQSNLDFFSSEAISALDRQQLAAMLYLIADQLRPVDQRSTLQNQCQQGGTIDRVLAAS